MFYCLLIKFLFNDCKRFGLICQERKTCVKLLLSKSPKIVFKTDYRLMQVKSIAECSKGQCF